MRHTAAAAAAAKSAPLTLTDVPLFSTPKNMVNFAQYSRKSPALCHDVCTECFFEKCYPVVVNVEVGQ